MINTKGRGGKDVGWRPLDEWMIYEGTVGWMRKGEELNTDVGWGEDVYVPWNEESGMRDKKILRWEDLEWFNYNFVLFFY
jgi:hypothetical protein